jgi:hypothetical protein
VDYAIHWFVEQAKVESLSFQNFVFFDFQKVSDDDNAVLKRQLDELREQMNHKDLELKNYHRTVSNFERQLNEAENVCI